MMLQWALRPTHVQMDTFLSGGLKVWLGLGMGVPGVQMCSCLSGTLRPPGSEPRTGRRPGPVSPWMEQVIRKWGRQARQWRPT